MRLEKTLTDGMEFTRQETGERVIFNYFTFYSIVTGILMHYAGLSVTEAKRVLDESFIVQKPPTSYRDVAYLTHEYEYHWAMILAHGPAYWLKESPVSSDLPDDYDEWEADYIEQHQLADASYEYIERP